MKNIVSICFLVAITAILTVQAHAISWTYDLSRALESAASENKPVMIDFYTDWCGWCKKLDKDTYENAAVAGLAQKFICVKVNGDKEKELIRKYTIHGYPTIVFLKPGGSEIDRIVGYRDAGAFAEAMKKVLASVGPAKKEEPPAAKEKVELFGGMVTVNTGPEYRLEGVVKTAGGYKAVINGNMVGVGEAVRGAKVVDITDRSAKLNVKGKETLLEMQR